MLSQGNPDARKLELSPNNGKIKWLEGTSQLLVKETAYSSPFPKMSSTHTSIKGVKHALDPIGCPWRR